MSQDRIRNIGIAAHIDAGKTTVTERLLYFTGTTRKIGEVHDGQATMDFMRQEQERGITIASAAISCLWRDHRVNIIDTPGHVDFTVEVERSLRVLDGMIAVFCAVGGVEPQSETVWRQADGYRVPRLALVNKMDRPGADFHRCLEMMDSELGADALAIQIPLGIEENFQGVIDLVTMQALRFEDNQRRESEIPEEHREEAEQARGKLLERLADLDDGIMERVLEDQPVPPELIRRAIRQGVLTAGLTPVLCGAAYKNIGMTLLLDAVVDYLPSPLEAGGTQGEDPERPGNAFSIESREVDPFSALAFKIIRDPFVGQQTFIRIYSGRVRKGQTFTNATRGHKERALRILRIRAKERQDLDEAGAGDIVALIGLKATRTGDTLCAPERPVLLERIPIPQAVISQCIAAGSKEEQEKLGRALRSMALEDPSFQMRVEPETKEMILSGMGELHLEVLVDRLRTDAGFNVTVGEPAVAYRETISREVEGQYRHAKQTGGHGQFAQVELRLEPNSGGGFEFLDTTRGGVIPREYIPAVRQGVEDAMEEGLKAGFPVVDCRVTVFDGKSHDVDSSELAFRIASRAAFRELYGRAAPRLLEPIMRIEIATPDDHIGPIVGDLNRRRGKVTSMRRFRKGSQKIAGTVPLAAMFGYATTLRSLSSGRANHSMEFHRYEPVPQSVETELLEQARKPRD